MDTMMTDMLPQILHLIMALGAVLLLMGALAMLMKKLGLSTNSSIKSGDKRRLKVIESLPLDTRRRLVIVKCDGKEHLIILSANSECIVDTNIEPVDYSKNSDVRG